MDAVLTFLLFMLDSYLNRYNDLKSCIYFSRRKIGYFQFRTVFTILSNF